MRTHNKRSIPCGCSFCYGNQLKTQNGGERKSGNQSRIAKITSMVVYSIMTADVIALAPVALENQELIAKKLINNQIAAEIINTTSKITNASKETVQLPPPEILRAAMTMPGSQKRAIDRYLPRKYPRKTPTTGCQERISYP